MNHAQWLFEAFALRKKDELEAKQRSQLAQAVYRESVRAFRETLIHLLGLNIGAGKPNDEADTTPFIPFLLTFGRHDVVEELMARDAEERLTENALDNEGIDELNMGLSKLEMGDLEPLLFSGANSDDPFERWRSPEHQRLLRDIGIDVVPDEAEAKQLAEDELLLGRDPTKPTTKPIKGAMKPR